MLLQLWSFPLSEWDGFPSPTKDGCLGDSKSLWESLSGVLPWFFSVGGEGIKVSPPSKELQGPPLNLDYSQESLWILGIHGRSGTNVQKTCDIPVDLCPWQCPQQFVFYKAGLPGDSLWSWLRWFKRNAFNFSCYLALWRLWLQDFVSNFVMVSF